MLCPCEMDEAFKLRVRFRLLVPTADALSGKSVGMPTTWVVRNDETAVIPRPATQTPIMMLAIAIVLFSISVDITPYPFGFYTFLCSRL